LSHNIEIVNGKPQIAYVGEVPWHGLGTRVAPNLTPGQFIVEAGVDWEVDLVPAYADINGKQRSINRSALVRSSDDRILDIVTNDWHPMQNLDAFKFFDEYVKRGDLEMHTAGSLDNGRVVWALAKMKESFELFKGDKIDQYMLFSNPHKYGYAAEARSVFTRVVCENTVAVALRENTLNSVKISHRAEFDQDRVKMELGIAHQKADDYKEIAKFLGESKAEKQDIVEYFKTLFPVLSAKKEGEGRKTISKNASLALEVLETQPGTQFAPGSWWQAVNAVTFMTNHMLGKSQDRRLASTWYGSNKNLNSKAIKLALEYA
jgi:phage/plasmid-like protein (TIGR03299 family)